MTTDSFREIYNINGDLTAKEPSLTYYRLMFFEDGTAVSGFENFDCINCGNEAENQFLEKVSQNKQPEAERFYDGFNWGIYKIIGDTIKLQTVSHQPLLNPYWVLFEHWYVMSPDGTLFPIYSKNLIDGRVSGKGAEVLKEFKFIETNIRLRSDPWLKKEKRFWCEDK